MELKDFFNGSPVPDDVLNMQNYLQGARQEPDMGYASLGGDTLGAYVRSKNLLGVRPNLEPDMERNSISHEYNHAANHQMDMQGGEVWKRQQRGTNTPLDDQFLTAFRKMNQKSNLPSQDVEDAPYRWEDRNEARSYGLANMLYPQGVGFAVPPHYDASAAQESAVLMDLARRSAQQPRQSPPTFLQTLKTLFR